MANKMARGDRWVLVGDSITDAGRARPHGRAPYGLGNGYAALVHTMLTVHYPDLGLDLVNVGISGDTSRHVMARWAEDVQALKPDWISLMIGVNDVWRKFDHPESPQSHVPLDEYRSLVRAAIVAAESSVKGMVLMAPFFLDLDRSDPMRVMVDAYRLAMEELAREYGLPFFDTQEMFDGWLTRRPNETLSGDRVHPSLLGHYLLAQHLLRTLVAAGWIDGARQE